MHGCASRDICLQHVVCTFTSLIASHASTKSVREIIWLGPHGPVVVSTVKELVLLKAIPFNQLCPSCLKFGHQCNLVNELLVISFEARVLCINRAQRFLGFLKNVPLPPPITSRNSSIHDVLNFVIEQIASMTKIPDSS